MTKIRLEHNTARFGKQSDTFRCDGRQLRVAVLSAAVVAERFMIVATFDISWRQVTMFVAPGCSSKIVWPEDSNLLVVLAPTSFAQTSMNVV